MLKFSESPLNAERRINKRLQHTHIRVRAEPSSRDVNVEAGERPGMLLMGCQIDRIRLSERSQQEIHMGVLDAGEPYHVLFLTRKRRGMDLQEMFESIMSEQDRLVEQERERLVQERREYLEGHIKKFF